MRNSMFLMEDDWKSQQFEEAKQCLITRMRQDQIKRVQVALDDFANKYGITVDSVNRISIE